MMGNDMAGMGAEEKEQNGTREEGYDSENTRGMPGRARSMKKAMRWMNSEQMRR